MRSLYLGVQESLLCSPGQFSWTAIPSPAKFVGIGTHLIDVISFPRRIPTSHVLSGPLTILHDVAKARGIALPRHFFPTGEIGCGGSCGDHWLKSLTTT